MSTRFGEQIWVVKQSSWVVHNYHICAMALGRMRPR